MAKIDLTWAFCSFYSCQKTFNKLKEALDCADPAVALLALEGLYHIESDVDSRQFPDYRSTNFLKNFLRTWRCESPLCKAYRGRNSFGSVPRFLRSLTIFKTLEVPLFIDNYGDKVPLKSFGERIEDVVIDGKTPICHVTHSEEAGKICEEKQFKPSDKKNIIEGCWFGLKSPNDSGSVYGNRSFETTLSKLGITGLHQGEIVVYKNEVNVILYATDDPDTMFEDLKKPTADAVKEKNENAHVEISIFVPARFLPTSDKFMTVIRPADVRHGPICVRAARKTFSRNDCDELNFYR